MKNLLKLGLALGIGIFIQSSAAAQDSPDSNPNILAPTIVKIDYPYEKSAHRDQPIISNEFQKYVDSHSTEPVDIQRDNNNKGKLFIKGRGSVNHVRIFAENAGDDEYPVFQHTFRGVNFEEIDIKGLADGNYVIEYISPHSATQFPLGIKTIGTN